MLQTANTLWPPGTYRIVGRNFNQNITCWPLEHYSSDLTTRRVRKKGLGKGVGRACCIGRSSLL